MPDELNVPVGETGQTDSARADAGAGTAPDSVPNLVAGHGAKSVTEAPFVPVEGRLHRADLEERVKIASRLRKAGAIAPVNLLPLLILLLAACGKRQPDVSDTPDPDADPDPDPDPDPETAKRCLSIWTRAISQITRISPSPRKTCQAWQISCNLTSHPRPDISGGGCVSGNVCPEMFALDCLLRECLPGNVCPGMFAPGLFAPAHLPGIVCFGPFALARLSGNVNRRRISS